MASERLQRQIDRLLDEAEAAIARRNWPAVRDSAGAALALDPENRDAQAFLAGAEGRWDEAVEHLERAEAFCAEKGLVVELAHCRLALSDALRGRAGATAGAPQPDSGGLPAAAPAEEARAASTPSPQPSPRGRGSQSEDRRRAAALLDQALADYRRLGMPLDVQECLSRREFLGA